MRRLLVLLLVALCCGCTPAAIHAQAAAANAIAVAGNSALPLLAASYEREGLAAIARSTTQEQARAELVDVKARWAPTWAAWEALRAAHAAWATALEAGDDASLPTALGAVRDAWCEMEAAWPDGIALPAVPVRCGP